MRPRCRASGHLPLRRLFVPSPSTVAPPASIAPAVVPGGVAGSELPDIFRAADLTPLVVLLSLATAAALGAGHALTPGHGKTLMAAYLVGTRGSARHALGLGAAVSLSHTIGILALAGVVVAATDVVAPDAVVRLAPVVAAVSIVLDRRVDAGRRGQAPPAVSRARGYRRPLTSARGRACERPSARRRSWPGSPARPRPHSSARAPAPADLDHHLAQPVRAGASGRAHPFHERAADPVGCDRGGTTGIRAGPCRRLRPGHGRGHERDRPGPRHGARPRRPDPDRPGPRARSARRCRSSRRWWCSASGSS